MPINQHLQIPGELRERLRAAGSVFVLTGAGLSAESGVLELHGNAWRARCLNFRFEFKKIVK